MKRAHIEEEPKESQKYYEITPYPTSRDRYGSINYIRLKDSNDTILNQQVTIEILWPNGRTSEHKIRVTQDHSSMYDSDACTTFHETTVWSYIDIQYNDAECRNIKLNEIKGIKARIIDTITY